jgi:hypothetical protein
MSEAHSAVISSPIATEFILDLSTAVIYINFYFIFVIVYHVHIYSNRLGEPICCLSSKMLYILSMQ